MASEASKPRRSKKTSGRQRNYLIVGRDGTFLLASGATGKIRKLTPLESKQVVPLLKQRQKWGRKLAELLDRKDFPLGDDEGDGIIDLEV